jgi:hypothetical protein
VDECCARAEGLIKNMRDREISEVQQRHDYCMHRGVRAHSRITHSCHVRGHIRADAVAGSNELIEEDEISNISERERSSTRAAVLYANFELLTSRRGTLRLSFEDPYSQSHRNQTLHHQGLLQGHFRLLMFALYQRTNPLLYHHPNAS